MSGGGVGVVCDKSGRRAVGVDGTVMSDEKYISGGKSIDTAKLTEFLI